jgi:hypothetical protein
MCACLEVGRWYELTKTPKHLLLGNDVPLARKELKNIAHQLDRSPSGIPSHFWGSFGWFTSSRSG